MLANIPSLRTKYPTHADYAGETVQDVFPGDTLATATVRTATQFASVLLMNTGHETFDISQLPVTVQFSPIYAFLIDDFDQDGDSDILLGGNFYGVAPFQGRYDASYGTLLLGDGAGEFTAASLQKSGSVLTGEVRKIRSLQTASGEKLIMAARSNDTMLIIKQIQTEQ